MMQLNYFIYLTIWTDRPEQIVQTLIKVLLKEQFDQGLHYLSFHQYVYDTSLGSQMNLWDFQVSEY